MLDLRFIPTVLFEPLPYLNIDSRLNWI